MLNVLGEMLGYTFLVRAVVVGALVSICAALLGVSLVLKRYSMIGDGLSHVGFGALALATALHLAPLTVSIPVVVAAAFFLLRLSEASKIKGDAAIAIVSTASLAIGVVIISQTTGMNTDVCNYLFGSILAMTRSDVYLSVALSIVVIVLFLAFYHKLFAITFDETFARACGINTGVYNMLIALLTAVTIVVGMRMMGALLITSLIIFPALTSMRVFKTFRSVTISSAIISIVCFFAGVIISYTRATPTGASVVLCNIAVFLVFSVYSGFSAKIPPRKGIIGVATSAVVLSLFITGCDAQKSTEIATTDITTTARELPAIDIKEKMFIAQVNEVYLNQNDYIGRKVSLEGLFKTEEYDDGRVYHFVLRYGPGCCGNDGNAGFEVSWPREAWPREDEAKMREKEYPANDDWVKAEGVFKTYTEGDDGYPFLYIELESLTKLEPRGAEFVTQ